VEEIRFQAPRIGAFKLYTMLCGIFGRKNLPGRDSFFNLLRRKKLMLSPLKSRSTTNSNHRFHKYKNLIKGFTPTAPNSLWVSDITYIALKENVCYLHLVTDAYSHKIIGWCLAPGLHAIYTLEALNRALEQVKTGSVEGLIHHSDRGCQYCCNEYIRTLNERHIRISMTEDYKPTDNAIAERINGIIKTEWLYRKQKPGTIEEAREEIERDITFYNTQRPHMSNGMLTPEQAHHMQGELTRCWKDKIYRKQDKRE